MFAPLVAKAKSTGPQPAKAVDETHTLRRSLGDQATSSFVAPQPSRTGSAPSAETTGSNAARAAGQGTALSWDFSKISLHPSGLAEQPQTSPLHWPPCLPIQAKLKVGAVDDPLEHEADRVADQVMRMPAPEVATTPTPQQVSRMGSEWQEEEKLQKKEAVPAAPTLSEAPASVHAALRSPGEPLDAATRGYFEPRFGRDFSSVRVHTDAAAAQSARDVNAQAYTVGHTIAFDSGQFAPGSHEGRRLLAHELTHALQQGASAIRQSAMSDGIHMAAAGHGAIDQSEGRVQRFTEPGHKLIGDAAFGTELLSLGEVKMSYGDAVALGDYFGSFDHIRRLAGKEGKERNTKGVLRYVLWVKIRKHKKETKLGDWYDETAVFQAEQISRSLDSKNISHFPNPRSGDTTLDPLQKNQRVGDDKKPLGAAATYRQAHEEAMWMAYINGTHQQNNDDALLADGFACHFLTDSFSASHLRTPRASIKEYWDQKVPGFRNKLIQWLAYQISQQPLSNVFAVNIAENIGALAAVGSIENFVITKLSILLSGGDFSFGDVVSLIIHDAEGAATVEASIDGSPITLVGDKDLVDEKAVDDLDPEGDKVYSLKKAGAAADTSKAAIAAVKASLDDIYDAYMAGLPENLGTIGLGYAGFGDLRRTTHHKDFDTFKKDTLGRRHLYRAEQLVPTAVDDSRLPPEKKTLPWMQNSVDDLMSNSRIKDALVVFGRGEAKVFSETLKQMDDLRPAHRAVIEKALIAPLDSGDPERIGRLFKSIIAGPRAGLQVGPQGVEKKRPGGELRITFPGSARRFDL